MQILAENDYLPIVTAPDFAAPQIVKHLLDDPVCGISLRVYVALSDNRLGARLSPEDRWINRYFWFLRFVSLHRAKYGYDAGMDDQLSDLLSEAQTFEIDFSILQEIEAAARST